MGLKATKTGYILQNSLDASRDLRERLADCGTPADWGWSFCRTAACHRCRKHRVISWIKKASTHFLESDARDLRMVTVMLKPVAGIEGLAPAIKAAKVDWRNLIYRMREANPQADNIRLFGAAEVDWYFPHHIDRLSNYKRTQIRELGFDVTAADVWMPHFHIIADLAGVPEVEFAARLERQWPGSRRVDVQAFDPIRPVDKNVARILSYATKHKHFYKIDPFGDPAFVRWPVSAMAQYYNMLHDCGGFSLLKFEIKPKKKEKQAVARKATKMREPMPCLF